MTLRYGSILKAVGLISDSYEEVSEWIERYWD